MGKAKHAQQQQNLLLNKLCKTSSYNAANSQTPQAFVAFKDFFFFFGYIFTSSNMFVNT